MGAAETRAVADGEDLADAGAALCVGQRFHRAAAARHEAMGAAQRARQFRRRGETVAQRHDIGVDRQITRLDPLHPSLAHQARHLAIPVQQAAQPVGEAQAFEQQAGLGRSGGQKIAPSGGAGAAGCFEDGDDVGAAV